MQVFRICAQSRADTLRLVPLLPLLLVAASAACSEASFNRTSSGSRIERPGNSAKPAAGDEGPGDDDGRDEGQDDDTDDRQDTAEEDSANSEGTGDSDAEAIEYPVMYYKGTGCMTTRGSGSAIIRTMHSNLRQEELTLTTTQASAASVTTPHAEKVNDALSRTMGAIRFERTTYKDRKELGGQYLNTKFLILANSITKTTGERFEFSRPIPVMMFPAPATRYDILKKGKMQFATQVTGAGAFTLKSTVELIEASDAEVRITISHEIPEDVLGRIYGSFPLPRFAEYRIGPAEKRINSIESFSCYHDDKREDQYFTTRTYYQLCKVTSSKGEESLSSCDHDTSPMGAMGSNQSCIMANQQFAQQSALNRLNLAGVKCGS